MSSPHSIVPITVLPLYQPSPRKVLDARGEPVEKSHGHTGVNHAARHEAFVTAPHRRNTPQTRYFRLYSRAQVEPKT